MYPSHVTRQLLPVVCLLASLRRMVAAQSISPSNGSLPVDSHSPQIQLNSRYDIDPLTDEAGLGATLQELQTIGTITGTLVAINSIDVTSLSQGDIAYISCDPYAYEQGYANVQQTVQSSIQRIQGQSGNAGAVILYSLNSIFCTYTEPEAPGYPYIFTMVNATESGNQLSMLTTQSSVTAQSTIALQASLMNNTSSAQDALGPAPTTAVAMIILYSITGIITTLFLGIICTGAVRAHRHPERYGPRNIMGRARQTRARGIARAMLESLPIVKFGEAEQEDPKDIPSDGDMELGHTRRHDTITPVSSDTERVPITSGNGRSAGTNTDSAAAESMIKKGNAKSTVEGTTENTENGLACSVCTDDFIKGQDLRVLPCNHRFHPECIDPWLLNVSGTCPLCRVDLRPTADRTDDDGEGQGASPNAYLPAQSELSASEPWNAADQSDSNAGASTSDRRRSNGLSLYIRHTLNFRRMRDATPEERIDALRRIRNANRANHGDFEPAERNRNRISSRLSRLFTSPQAGSRDALPADSESNEQNEGVIR